MFTGAELEEMVCGSTIIDTENLKQNTIYEGCNATSPHILSVTRFYCLVCDLSFAVWMCEHRHFWVAFDRLSQEDRRRFVSFAYGRSRLPRDLTQLQHKFKLTTLSMSSNGSTTPADYLPHSHTCFFHVEMPEYTSPEQCLEKILIAIYC